MEKNFSLEILTPHKKLYSGEVSSLVAPGALGYLGVLAHHAPLLTTLSPGKVVFRDAGGRATTLQSKGSGLLEVYRNKALLLADDISP